MISLMLANHCLFICPNISNICRDHTAVVAACSDGELYSATVADISSRDVLIYKKPIRSEQHDSQWLNGTIQHCASFFNLINFYFCCVILIKFPNFCVIYNIVIGLLFRRSFLFIFVHLF